MTLHIQRNNKSQSKGRMVKLDGSSTTSDLEETLHHSIVAKTWHSHKICVFPINISLSWTRIQNSVWKAIKDVEESPFPTFILEISSFVRRRDYNSFFKVVGQKALVLYYNQLKSCWWWWLDCNINRAYIFKKKHINSLLCLFFSLKESLKRGRRLLRMCV